MNKPKNRALGKRAFLIAFEIICLFLIFSCKAKTPKGMNLENSNIYRNGSFVPTVDSVGPASYEEYCFEIVHEQVNNLEPYQLVVELNGIVIYSDHYQHKIHGKFAKSKELNTFTIILANRKTNILFAWSNKDVYNFKTSSDRCYTVELLSEQNIIHSEGIDMKIK